MKKFLLLLAAVMLTGMFNPSAAKKPTKSEQAMQQFRYELECAGNGVQGTYLVRVWTYDKKQKDAQAACARNAVHGVIFKGFAGGGINTATAFLGQRHPAFFEELHQLTVEEAPVSIA